MYIFSHGSKDLVSQLLMGDSMRFRGLCFIRLAASVGIMGLKHFCDSWWEFKVSLKASASCDSCSHYVATLMKGGRCALNVHQGLTAHMCQGAYAA